MISVSTAYAQRLRDELEAASQAVWDLRNKRKRVPTQEIDDLQIAASALLRHIEEQEWRMKRLKEERQQAAA